MTRHEPVRGPLLTPADDWKSVPMDRTTVDRLPALLPIPAAAKILGISRASAYRYAANDELPVQRFGSRVYVVTVKIRYLLVSDELDAAA